MQQHLKKWRFIASYDNFVLAQTFVFHMNICGKNRQLLVIAKRWSATDGSFQQKSYTPFNQYI
jgi:hypothetical protein